MRACVAAFAIAVALAAFASGQQTLKVPSQYKTITAAITAATAGDTVLVAPGTYNEPVDFAGKNILVTSASGFSVTTILSTDFTKPGVRFQNGEGPGAVLEGFTVTSNAHQRGGNGIRISSASPTIRSCRITGNSGYTVVQGGPVGGGLVVSYGGGFDCFGSGARIEDCLIERNSAHATGPSSGWSARAYGGGIHGVDSTLSVHRCAIMFNGATADAGQMGQESAAGGGLYLQGDSSHFYNCAIIGNAVRAKQGNGGGVAGSGRGTALNPRFVHCNVGGNSAWSGPTPTGYAVAGGHYVNCIIRENLPAYLSFQGSATHCNIQGGYTGTGNFDLDPKFADQQFHLRPDSPCRNRGTSQVTGLPPTDHEGDPRVAEGKSDVGMDEYFARFRWGGAARPGGKITLVFDGAPGGEVYWAFSLRKVNRPAAIPGLEGWFALDPLSFGVMRVARMPSPGQLSVPFAIAPGFPRVTVHMQALVGKQMTRLSTITIQ